MQIKKRTILDVMYHIIPYNLSSKSLDPIVTDSYIRDRILNISLFFFTKSHFAVPKKIKLLNTLLY